MDDGLDVGVNEFKKMNAIDRDVVIYNNLVHCRKRLKGYSLNKKIQYMWLGLLTIFVGAKKYLGA